MQKKGAIKLSFGMIFSIILIIIFIVFAFYAIQKFLQIQDAAKVGQFTNNLQSDINSAWEGSQRSQEVNYFLPKKIEYVCFIDINSARSGTNRNFYEELEYICYNDENMAFYPIGSSQGTESKEMKHIDIEKITSDENPFCIKNINGKVEMTIQKSFGEELVTIVN